MISDETLLSQIRKLPEREGRKVTFEMIDEYPIVSLPRVLDDVKREGIRLPSKPCVQSKRHNYP